MIPKISLKVKDKLVTYQKTFSQASHFIGK